MFLNFWNDYAVCGNTNNSLGLFDFLIMKNSDVTSFLCADNQYTKISVSLEKLCEGLKGCMLQTAD